VLLAEKKISKEQKQGKKLDQKKEKKKIAKEEEKRSKRST
jgi:hypothetical protein